MTNQNSALETLFNKHFVVRRQGHLQSNQGWAEDGQCTDDAQNVVFLES